MIDKNLDNERASYAYKCVEEIKNQNDEKTEKKYRSAVRSSGALMQKSGLMQTLAFYLSKKDNEHYNQLARHILHWKCVHDEGEDSLDIYHKFLELPDEKIMYKTQEVKALIVWLKRFADAMLKGED